MTNKTYSKVISITLFTILSLMLSIPITSTPTSNSVSVGSPDSQGLIDVIITKDGIWNPTNEYNRYRRNDFPSGNFFQWWYYAIKNPSTGENFAICYYLNYCENNTELDGIMILFSYINPQFGKFQLAYKMPISNYEYQGNYVQMIFDDGKYQHIPISDDQYYLTGLMNDQSNEWTTCSNIEGWNEATICSWNITLSRVAGCVAENDFINIQEMQIDLGLSVENASIMWDTHMFDALVSGSISIGDSVWNLSDPKIRGYGDMDYGQTFISETDDLSDPTKYYWGWLSTTNPNVADPSSETSIIVGCGKDKAIMGIEAGSKAVMAAASNILGNDVTWKSVQVNPDNLGISFVEKTSWGSNLDCFIDVQYNIINWFTFTDQYGSANVPSHQNIILENEWCKIIINAYVNASCVSRLLTPNNKGIWSNFEALGATITTQIYAKSYKWYDVLHTTPKYALSSSFVDTVGGLEFGYSIDNVSP